MKSILLWMMAIVLICSCQTDRTGHRTEQENKAEEANPIFELKMEDKSSGIVLKRMSESPKFPNTRIKSMKYENGKFDFEIFSSLDEYVLGQQTEGAPKKMCANSAKGQHLHVIVDNQPYAAKYESSFDHKIENGSHHLLAFLSRSYHESLKKEDQHVAKLVNVEDGKFIEERDIQEPMIFYSRPKGNYVGEDTKNVMLDFYLVNADVPNDFLIKVTINGIDFFLEEWRPYIIKGLPMGENTIELNLLKLNEEGTGIEVVPSPIGPVQRTFKLIADPAKN